MNELFPAGDVPPLGRLIEALSGDRADVASLSQVLTGVLSDALPAGTVDVEYERSVSDRVRGRAGTPVSVRVNLGEKVLSMGQSRSGRPEPVIAHVVRGVVISRATVTVSQWVRVFADEVSALAAEDAAARAALNRLLLS